MNPPGDAVRPQLFAERRGESINRRIFTGILMAGGVGLLSKFAATSKDLVVARSFGLDDSIDAFLLALSVPMFAINAFASSVPAAMVPAYVVLKDRDAAQRFFAETLGWILALLLGLTAVLALVSPWLLPALAVGFSAEKVVLTRQLFFLLLPILTIHGLTVSFGAVLNARERFAWTAIAAFMTPAVPLVALLVRPAEPAVFVLTGATAIGFFAEALLVGWALFRKGLLVRPRWKRPNGAVAAAMTQYLPLVAATFLMAGTKFVDQGMAASLPPGSVAALSYGSKMVTFVLSLGTMSLGSVVLPYLSRIVADRDWRALRQTLRFYGLLIAAASTAVSFVLIAFARPLLTLLFLGGVFRPEDLADVVRVQQLSAIQIPFYFLGLVAVRVLYALRSTRGMIVIYGISLLSNTVLDLMLMRRMGVAGIALSTSCVCVIYFVQYLVAIARVSRRYAAQGFPPTKGELR